MSQFHQDEKHDTHFAVLFGSFNIEDKFKNFTSLKYVTVKDREEKRISSMFNSAGEIGSTFVKLQTSALACIAIAKTQEEALLKEMGLIAVVPQGMVICPTCLDKAIMTCEENLEVLKDLREATKKYATAKL